MGTVPRLLVIVNSEGSGPRRLRPCAEAAGIEIVEQFGGDGLPESLSDFDGLVLLGGGFMPDNYRLAPWLRSERKLALEAIDLDLPTLGICLGAQLIAEVAGGEVRENFGPQERGSTMIRPTTAGLGDSVIGVLGSSAPMIENHQDMITRLPPSSTLLASSDAIERQAFVIGQHVRGVQFHPETGAEHLAKWNEAALQGDGYELRELISIAERSDEESTGASRRLIEAFLSEVSSRAARSAP